SAGICGSRAKVSIGGVMLVGGRKIAYRYVMIDIGCSVDHCGLLSQPFIEDRQRLSFVLYYNMCKL
ncbi:MAG TPA: hypothetical protein VGL27_02330, partial [Negativicutes bacterium]